MKKFSYDSSITKSYQKFHRHSSKSGIKITQSAKECKFCQSHSLITKSALSADHQEIVCGSCGRFQKLVKQVVAIASNNNQECKYCQSTNLIQQDAPPPHYKKLVCGSCGKFQIWLKKQEYLDRYRKLIILLSEQPIKGWDGIFIKNLYSKLGVVKNFSPRQINNLTRISEAWGVR